MGKWLSLVEHVLWAHGVAGSNPAFLTTMRSSSMEERLPVKQTVEGSNPSSSAKRIIVENILRSRVLVTQLFHMQDNGGSNPPSATDTEQWSSG